MQQRGCLINADLGGRAVDPTVPECRRYLWEALLKPRYFDQGVSAFWRDETSTADRAPPASPCSEPSRRLPVGWTRLGCSLPIYPHLPPSLPISPVGWTRRTARAPAAAATATTATTVASGRPPRTRTCGSTPHPSSRSWPLITATHRAHIHTHSHAHTHTHTHAHAHTHTHKHTPPTPTPAHIVEI